MLKKTTLDIEKNRCANLLASKREYWVDFLKGIMIFTVVMGHSGIPGILLHLIYMFHMPIFFVISGYLYDDRGEALSQFIRRKAKSLLYPYIVFGTLIIIYNTAIAIFSGNNSLADIGKRFVALIYGNYIWDNNASYIGVLWFVIALFCSKVLYYVAMHRKGKEKVAHVIIIATIGTIFSILNMYYKLRLPWCLDIACIAFLFFFVGTWFRNHEITATKAIIALMIGFILGTLNFLFMKVMGCDMTRVDMLYMNYGILPLFLVSASLISVGFMRISKAIYRNCKFEIVEHMGRISLLIMVIHLYVIQVAGRVLNNWIVIFIAASAVSMTLGVFIEKYVPWLYRMPMHNSDVEVKS